jgi:hypothetical protein
MVHFIHCVVRLQDKPRLSRRERIWRIVSRNVARALNELQQAGSVSPRVQRIRVD